MIRKLLHDIRSYTDTIRCECVNLSHQEGNEAMKASLRRVNYANQRIRCILDSLYVAEIYNACCLRLTIPLSLMLSKAIESFEDDCRFRGTTISIKGNNLGSELKLSADKFYSFAISHVIKNAVVYASLGSKIIIHIFPDRLEISNIGLPISDDELNKIFYKGFRGKAAVQNWSKGMGYGLFVARKVFDAHGSSISIMTEPISESDVYAETAVAEFLNSLSEDERNTLIYNNLCDSEKVIAKSVYERLRERKELFCDNKYLNTDISQSFMIRRELGLDFLSLEEELFNHPISKITAIIYYGEAKKHLSN